MKIGKILLPIMILGSMNNANNQIYVRADKAACIQECVRVHTEAAKACCAVTIYNPVVFAGCMALAGGSLTLCLSLCSAGG